MNIFMEGNKIISICIGLNLCGKLLKHRTKSFNISSLDFWSEKRSHLTLCLKNEISKTKENLYRYGDIKIYSWLCCIYLWDIDIYRRYIPNYLRVIMNPPRLFTIINVTGSNCHRPISKVEYFLINTKLEDGRDGNFVMASEANIANLVMASEANLAITLL